MRASDFRVVTAEILVRREDVEEAREALEALSRERGYTTSIDERDAVLDDLAAPAAPTDSRQPTGSRHPS
jgi:hypothetical protein